jgi:hypothetical protein
MMIKKGCQTDRAEPIPVQRAWAFQEILLFYGYEDSSDDPPRLDEPACQELATANDSSFGRRFKTFFSRRPVTRA